MYELTMNKKWLWLVRTIALSTLTLFLYSSISAPYAESSLWDQRRKSLQQTQQQKQGLTDALKTEVAHSTTPKMMLATSLIKSVGASSAFSLPQELGVVTESWANTKARPSAGLVVHIQDAHGNFGAQKNTAAILKYLSSLSNFHVSGQELAVFIEGSVGQVHTDWVSALTNSSSKNQLAYSLLSRGEIMGEEYAAITQGESNFRIQGIENKELYDANLNSRKMIAPWRAQLLNQSAQLNQRLDQVKNRVYSANLLKLDRAQGAFDSGKMDLKDYVSLLASYGLNNYPNLQKLLEVTTLEKSFDLAKIESQNQDLIRLIGQSLDRSSVEQLAQESLRYRLGQRSALSYYSMLLEVCKTLNLDSGQLSTYLAYLKKAESIDSEILYQELQASERAAFNQEIALQNSQNNRLASLAMVARLLHLENKFWNEEFAPQNWNTYQNWNQLGEVFDIQDNGISFQYYDKFVASWEQDLNLKTPADFVVWNAEAKEGVPSEKELRTLQESYYKLAFSRDQVLVRNMLKNLPSNQASVLIAGGFHTAGITRNLRERQIPYVVVRPNLKAASDAPQTSVKNQNTSSDYFSVAKTYAANLKALIPFAKKSGDKNYKQILDQAIDALENRLVLSSPMQNGGKYYVLGAYQRDYSREYFSLEFNDQAAAKQMAALPNQFKNWLDMLRASAGTVTFNPSILAQASAIEMLNQMGINAVLSSQTDTVTSDNLQFTFNSNLSLAQVQAQIDQVVSPTHVVFIEQSGTNFVVKITKKQAAADLEERAALQQDRLAAQSQERQAIKVGEKQASIFYPFLLLFDKYNKWLSVFLGVIFVPLIESFVLYAQTIGVSSALWFIAPGSFGLVVLVALLVKYKLANKTLSDKSRLLVILGVPLFVTSILYVFFMVLYFSGGLDPVNSIGRLFAGAAMFSVLHFVPEVMTKSTRTRISERGVRGNLWAFFRRLLYGLLLLTPFLFGNATTGVIMSFLIHASINFYSWQKARRNYIVKPLSPISVKGESIDGATDVTMDFELSKDYSRQRELLKKALKDPEVSNFIKDKQIRFLKKKGPFYSNRLAGTLYLDVETNFKNEFDVKFFLIQELVSDQFVSSDKFSSNTNDAQKMAFFQALLFAKKFNWGLSGYLVKAINDKFKSVSATPYTYESIDYDGILNQGKEIKRLLNVIARSYDIAHDTDFSKDTTLFDLPVQELLNVYSNPKERDLYLRHFTAFALLFNSLKEEEEIKKGKKTEKRITFDSLNSFLDFDTGGAVDHKNIFSQLSRFFIQDNKPLIGYSNPIALSQAIFLQSQLKQILDFDTNLLNDIRFLFGNYPDFPGFMKDLKKVDASISAQTLLKNQLFLYSIFPSLVRLDKNSIADKGYDLRLIPKPLLQDDFDRIIAKAEFVRQLRKNENKKARDTVNGILKAQGVWHLRGKILGFLSVIVASIALGFGLQGDLSVPLLILATVLYLPIFYVIAQPKKTVATIKYVKNYFKDPIKLSGDISLETYTDLNYFIDSQEFKDAIKNKEHVQAVQKLIRNLNDSTFQDSLNNRTLNTKRSKGSWAATYLVGTIVFVVLSVYLLFAFDVVPLKSFGFAAATLGPVLLLSILQYSLDTKHQSYKEFLKTNVYFVVKIIFFSLLIAFVTLLLSLEGVSDFLSDVVKFFGFDLDTDIDPENNSTPGTDQGSSAFQAWVKTYNLSGDEALPTADPDNDGLSNLEEFELKDPFNPTKSYLNDQGTQVSSNPDNKDTDSDGLLDLDEFTKGTDLTKADSDGDGLNDKIETTTLLDNGTLRTNPLMSDTDGGGESDSSEIEHRSNPRDSNDDVRSRVPENSNLMPQTWVNQQVQSTFQASKDQNIADDVEEQAATADALTTLPAKLGLNNSEGKTYTALLNDQDQVQLQLNGENYDFTLENNADIDGDGIPNVWEYRLNLNPFTANNSTTYQEDILSEYTTDSDSGGIPDSAETAYNKYTDAQRYEITTNFSKNDLLDDVADYDEDGYSNVQEYYANTNPFNVADFPGAPQADPVISLPAPDAPGLSAEGQTRFKGFTLSLYGAMLIVAPIMFVYTAITSVHKQSKKSAKKRNINTITDWRLRRALYSVSYVLGRYNLSADEDSLEESNINRKSKNQQALERLVEDTVDKVLEIRDTRGFHNFNSIREFELYLGTFLDQKQVDLIVHAVRSGELDFSYEPQVNPKEAKRVPPIFESPKTSAKMIRWLQNFFSDFSKNVSKNPAWLALYFISAIPFAVILGILHLYFALNHGRWYKTYSFKDKMRGKSKNEVIEILQSFSEYRGIPSIIKALKNDVISHTDLINFINTLEDSKDGVAYDRILLFVQSKGTVYLKKQIQSLSVPTASLSSSPVSSPSKSSHPITLPDAELTKETVLGILDKMPLSADVLALRHLIQQDIISPAQLKAMLGKHNVENLTLNEFIEEHILRPLILQEYILLMKTIHPQFEAQALDDTRALKPGVFKDLFNVIYQEARTDFMNNPAIMTPRTVVAITVDSDKNFNRISMELRNNHYFMEARNLHHLIIMKYLQLNQPESGKKTLGQQGVLANILVQFAADMADIYLGEDSSLQNLSLAEPVGFINFQDELNQFFEGWVTLEAFMFAENSRSSKRESGSMARDGYRTMETGLAEYDIMMLFAELEARGYDRRRIPMSAFLRIFPNYSRYLVFMGIKIDGATADQYINLDEVLRNSMRFKTSLFIEGAFGNSPVKDRILNKIQSLPIIKDLEEKSIQNWINHFGGPRFFTDTIKGRDIKSIKSNYFKSNNSFVENIKSMATTDADKLAVVNSILTDLSLTTTISSIDQLNPNLQSEIDEALKKQTNDNVLRKINFYNYVSKILNLPFSDDVKRDILREYILRICEIADPSVTKFSSSPDSDPVSKIRRFLLELNPTTFHQNPSADFLNNVADLLYSFPNYYDPILMQNYENIINLASLPQDEMVALKSYFLEVVQQVKQKKAAYKKAKIADDALPSNDTLERIEVYINNSIDNGIEQIPLGFLQEFNQIFQFLLAEPQDQWLNAVMKNIEEANYPNGRPNTGAGNGLDSIWTNKTNDRLKELIPNDNMRKDVIAILFEEMSANWLNISSAIKSDYVAMAVRKSELLGGSKQTEFNFKSISKGWQIFWGIVWPIVGVGVSALVGVYVAVIPAVVIAVLFLILGIWFVANRPTAEKPKLPNPEQWSGNMILDRSSQTTVKELYQGKLLAQIFTFNYWSIRTTGQKAGWLITTVIGVVGGVLIWSYFGAVIGVMVLLVGFMLPPAIWGKAESKGRIIVVIIAFALFWGALYVGSFFSGLDTRLENLVSEDGYARVQALLSAISVVGIILLLIIPIFQAFWQLTGTSAAEKARDREVWAKTSKSITKTFFETIYLSLGTLFMAFMFQYYIFVAEVPTFFMIFLGFGSVFVAKMIVSWILSFQMPLFKQSFKQAPWWQKIGRILLLPFYILHYVNMGISYLGYFKPLNFLVRFLQPIGVSGWVSLNTAGHIRTYREWYSEFLRAEEHQSLMPNGESVKEYLTRLLVDMRRNSYIDNQELSEWLKFLGHAEQYIINIVVNNQWANEGYKPSSSWLYFAQGAPVHFKSKIANDYMRQSFESISAKKPRMASISEIPASSIMVQAGDEDVWMVFENIIQRGKSGPKGLDGGELADNSTLLGHLAKSYPNEWQVLMQDLMLKFPQQVDDTGFDYTKERTFIEFLQGKEKGGFDETTDIVTRMRQIWNDGTSPDASLIEAIERWVTQIRPSGSLSMERMHDVQKELHLYFSHQRGDSAYNKALREIMNQYSSLVKAYEAIQVKTNPNLSEQIFSNNYQFYQNLVNQRFTGILHEEAVTANHGAWRLQLHNPNDMQTSKIKSMNPLNAVKTIFDINDAGKNLFKLPANQADTNGYQGNWAQWRQDFLQWKQANYIQILKLLEEKRPLNNPWKQLNNLVQSFELSQKEFNAQVPFYNDNDKDDWWHTGVRPGKVVGMGTQLWKLHKRHMAWDGFVNYSMGQTPYHILTSVLADNQGRTTTFNPRMILKDESLPGTQIYAVAMKSWLGPVQNGLNIGKRNGYLLGNLTNYGKGFVNSRTFAHQKLHTAEDSVSHQTTALLYNLSLGLLPSRKKDPFRSTGVNSVYLPWLELEWGRPSLLSEALLGTEGVRYAYNVTLMRYVFVSGSIYDDPEVPFDKKITDTFLYLHYLATPIMFLVSFLIPILMIMAGYNVVNDAFFFAFLSIMIGLLITYNGVQRYKIEKGSMVQGLWNGIADFIKSFFFFGSLMVHNWFAIRNAVNYIFSFMPTNKNITLKSSVVQDRYDGNQNFSSRYGMIGLMFLGVYFILYFISFQYSGGLESFDSSKVAFALGFFTVLIYYFLYISWVNGVNSFGSWKKKDTAFVKVLVAFVAFSLIGILFSLWVPVEPVMTGYHTLDWWLVSIMPVVPIAIYNSWGVNRVEGYNPFNNIAWGLVLFILLPVVFVMLFFMWIRAKLENRWRNAALFVGIGGGLGASIHVAISVLSLSGLSSAIVILLLTVGIAATFYGLVKLLIDVIEKNKREKNIQNIELPLQLRQQQIRQRAVLIFRVVFLIALVVGFGLGSWQLFESGYSDSVKTILMVFSSLGLILSIAGLGFWKDFTTFFLRYLFGSVLIVGVGAALALAVNSDMGIIYKIFIFLSVIFAGLSLAIPIKTVRKTGEKLALLTEKDENKWYASSFWYSFIRGAMWLTMPPSNVLLSSLDNVRQDHPYHRYADQLKKFQEQADKYVRSKDEFNGVRQVVVTAEGFRSYDNISHRVFEHKEPVKLKNGILYISSELFEFFVQNGSDEQAQLNKFRSFLGYLQDNEIISKKDYENIEKDFKDHFFDKFMQLITQYAWEISRKTNSKNLPDQLRHQMVQKANQKERYPLLVYLFYQKEIGEFNPTDAFVSNNNTEGSELKSKITEEIKKVKKSLQIIVTEDGVPTDKKLRELQELRKKVFYETGTLILNLCDYLQDQLDYQEDLVKVSGTNDAKVLTLLDKIKDLIKEVKSMDTSKYDAIHKGLSDALSKFNDLPNGWKNGKNQSPWQRVSWLRRDDFDPKKSLDSIKALMDKAKEVQKPEPALKPEPAPAPAAAPEPEPEPEPAPELKLLNRKGSYISIEAFVFNEDSQDEFPGFDNFSLSNLSGRSRSSSESSNIEDNFVFAFETDLPNVKENKSAMMSRKSSGAYGFSRKAEDYPNSDRRIRRESSSTFGFPLTEESLVDASNASVFVGGTQNQSSSDATDGYIEVRPELKRVPEQENKKVDYSKTWQEIDEYYGNLDGRVRSSSSELPVDEIERIIKEEKVAEFLAEGPIRGVTLSDHDHGESNDYTTSENLLKKILQLYPKLNSSAASSEKDSTQVFNDLIASLKKLLGIQDKISVPPAPADGSAKPATAKPATAKLSESSHVSELSKAVKHLQQKQEYHRLLGEFKVSLGEYMKEKKAPLFSIDSRIVKKVENLQEQYETIQKRKDQFGYTEYFLLLEFSGGDDFFQETIKHIDKILNISKLVNEQSVRELYRFLEGKNPGPISKDLKDYIIEMFPDGYKENVTANFMTTSDRVEGWQNLTALVDEIKQNKEVKVQALLNAVKKCLGISKKNKRYFTLRSNASSVGSSTVKRREAEMSEENINQMLANVWGFKNFGFDDTGETKNPPINIAAIKAIWNILDSDISNVDKQNNIVDILKKFDLSKKSAIKEPGSEQVNTAYFNSLNKFRGCVDEFYRNAIDVKEKGKGRQFEVTRNLDNLKKGFEVFQNGPLKHLFVEEEKFGFSTQFDSLGSNSGAALITGSIKSKTGTVRAIVGSLRGTVRFKDESELTPMTNRTVVPAAGSTEETYGFSAGNFDADVKAALKFANSLNPVQRELSALVGERSVPVSVRLYAIDEFPGGVGTGFGQVSGNQIVIYVALQGQDADLVLKELEGMLQNYALTDGYILPKGSNPALVTVWHEMLEAAAQYAVNSSDFLEQDGNQLSIVLHELANLQAQTVAPRDWGKTALAHALGLLPSLSMLNNPAKKFSARTQTQAAAALPLSMPVALGAGPMLVPSAAGLTLQLPSGLALQASGLLPSNVLQNGALLQDISAAELSLWLAYLAKENQIVGQTLALVQVWSQLPQTVKQASMFVLGVAANIISNALKMSNKQDWNSQFNQVQKQVRKMQDSDAPAAPKVVVLDLSSSQLMEVYMAVAQTMQAAAKVDGAPQMTLALIGASDDQAAQFNIDGITIMRASDAQTLQTQIASDSKTASAQVIVYTADAQQFNHWKGISLFNLSALLQDLSSGEGFTLSGPAAMMVSEVLMSLGGSATGVKIQNGKVIFGTMKSVSMSEQVDQMRLATMAALMSQ